MHVGGINEHLGGNLTESEMAELRRIMAKLASGIHPTDTTETPGAVRD